MRVRSFDLVVYRDRDRESLDPYWDVDYEEVVADEEASAVEASTWYSDALKENGLQGCVLAMRESGTQEWGFFEVVASGRSSVGRKGRVILKRITRPEERGHAGS